MDLIRRVVGSSTLTLPSVTGQHPRFLARLGFPLRPPISPHAADRSRLLGVQSIREHHVSHGIELLLRHHIPGLQR